MRKSKWIRKLTYKFKGYLRCYDCGCVILPNEEQFTCSEDEWSCAGAIVCYDCYENNEHWDY